VTTPRPVVLFVCVHNAGRSQMAAALFARAGGNFVLVRSAGTAGIVVTMGCGDACPVYPGKRYLDWKLPGPAGKPAAEVRPIRDEIERSVRGLLADLGIRVEGPETATSPGRWAGRAAGPEGRKGLAGYPERLRWIRDPPGKSSTT
jgi:arsenate reductase